MMANRNYDINEIFGWGIIATLALLLLIGVVVVIGGWTMGFTSTAKNEAAIPLEKLPIVENPVQMVQPQPVAEPEQAQDLPPVVARVREPRLRPEPEPRLRQEPSPAPTNRSIPVVPRSLPDNDNAVSVRNREPLQSRPQSADDKTVSAPSGSRFLNIFDAARGGSVEDVRYFLDRGIDVNIMEEVVRGNDRSRGGSTPLHHAIMSTSKDAFDVVQFLVSQGADVNSKSAIAGMTPLHSAVSSPNMHSAEIVTYLVSQGADIESKAQGERTPLHLAASEYGNPAHMNYIFRFLLANGANVNARGQVGRTPLDWANTDEKRQILREAGGKFGRELDNEPSASAQRR